MPGQEGGGVVRGAREVVLLLPRDVAAECVLVPLHELVVVADAGVEGRWGALGLQQGIDKGLLLRRSEILHVLADQDRGTE